MTLYRHKSTGLVVAAHPLTKTGRPSDHGAQRYSKGKDGTFGQGDFALWVGGRHLRYEKRDTFLQEYEEV